MVLFSLSTVSTSPRSVFSSALLSERMASAHTSMRERSCCSRSCVRKFDTTSEPTAIKMAATTRMIFTCRILSVHCMLSKRRCGANYCFVAIDFLLAWCGDKKWAFPCVTTDLGGMPRTSNDRKIVTVYCYGLNTILLGLGKHRPSWLRRDHWPWRAPRGLRHWPRRRRQKHCLLIVVAQAAGSPWPVARPVP